MSRNAKIAFAVLGALFICCACAGAGAFFALRSASRAFVTDQAELETIAANVAAYDLPPGYDELFGMRFFGFEIIALGSPALSTQPLIMLMNIPAGAGLGQAELERQMAQALRQQEGLQNLELAAVGETTVKIRDQNVTLTIREGSDAGGVAYRQVSGIFRGQSGPALLMIQGPQQGWDQGLIDSFVASIR
jgi:hypothetical protein